MACPILSVTMLFGRYLAFSQDKTTLVDAIIRGLEKSKLFFSYRCRPQAGIDPRVDKTTKLVEHA